MKTTTTFPLRPLRGLVAVSACVAALGLLPSHALADDQGLIPQLDPCNQPVLADWTAGADQYTDYYQKMLAFAANVPMPAITAAAKPQRPASKNRVVQAQYKADLATWRQAVARDQAAATKAAARLKQDLETTYQRARDDAQASEDNRETLISYNHDQEANALSSCEETMDAKANADYESQASKAAYDLQVDTDTAQQSYQTTVQGAQGVIDSNTATITTAMQDAKVACKKYAGSVTDPKKLKGKKLKAAQKHNKQVKTKLATCTKAVDRGADSPSKAADAQIANLKAAQVAVADAQAKITQAQATLDNTLRDRQQAYDQAQISLQAQFTINGIQRTFSYQKAVDQLDLKQSQCVTRSQRQLTNEQRAIDDAYTIAQRTIEDLYGVDYSSL